MKKVIIIGGGASGLTAAINSKNENNEVIILEKNKECGKKILVTGNGKCNYYNDDQSLEHYHSSNLEVVSDYINKERINKILPFFKSIGIFPDIKDGYYYPMSNQAISIRNALVRECENRKIKIVYNCEVNDIKKMNNEFIVKTNIDEYRSDILVISTGSKAFSKTGSTGDGYEFAKRLGHNIIKPLPGLVQLVSDNKIKEAAGVRCKVKLSLFENNDLIKEEVGELQITDYGISGIVSMQLSSYISKGLNNGNKEDIYINFLPVIDNIEVFINDLNNNVKNRTISELLDGLLNYKLVNMILKQCKINGDEYYYNLDENLKQKLISNLSSYKLNINGTKGFDNSQICIGGIPLEELKETYESKIIDNLFFTGEIIDINGDCGGYNLSISWISGIEVGERIKNECL
ncbi:MAG: aminoacetone oxidase family FAD-binding enzyme [Firmicutes bacterium]|nr:aminoacetone oxidase family FAD-binding enzyme [Bacillota bacterium]